MPLYEEYEEYTLKYKSNYGDRTVVLYKCGSFYEVYSINDGLVDIHSICDILQIQLSKRNKSINTVDRNNCLMAGFPEHALRKFVQILIDNNYTIVIIDQLTPPPKPKRGVTSIISPGTCLDFVNTPDSNYLCCLFFEKHADFKNINSVIWCIGLSLIDISVGTSIVYEIVSPTTDTSFAFNECYRILSSKSPKEYIILGDMSKDEFNSIKKELNIEDKLLHNKLNIYNHDIHNIIYQNKILDRVFKTDTMLSPLEVAGLERHPCVAKSYVFLIAFCLQHNEHILDKISPPTFMNETDDLILSYNCCKQLNISDYLLSLLNKCSTSMGKRLFKERLLKPTKNVHELENRYNDIASVMQIKDELQCTLKHVCDIDRHSRKIVLNQLNPCNLSTINDSMKKALVINDLLKENNVHNLILQDTMDQKLQEFHKYLQDTFDFEVCDMFTIDHLPKNIFKQGIFPELDLIETELNKEINLFNDFLSQMSSDYFKLESNEKDGFYITITAKRFKDYQAQNANKTIIMRSNEEFSFNKISSKPSSAANVKLVHTIFDETNQNIRNIQQKLCTCVSQCIKNVYVFISNEYYALLQKVSNWLALVDVVKTHAKNAICYNLKKPNIQNKYENKSFINAKDIRHPIVEQFSGNTQYVSNDIELNGNGVLLYGVNCCGKSTFSKALAINVIMAQCGSYVSSDMEFYPYESIFTRIPSGDDMTRGMSTFAVEISELRNILKRATRNSLIIGDELASGSEGVSATSIVAAAIETLSIREASFVFATHLHGLLDLNIIKKNKKLRVCHLSVKYDEESKELIYDRKLKDGNGSSLYGIEVCKFLGIPREFLDIAYNVRQEIEATTLKLKRSKYNKDFFVDVCAICGKRAEEVHHINEQHTADENGNINHTFHKNALHNLINLCQSCHDEVHNGNYKINGHISTSSGIRPDIIQIKSNENYDEIASQVLQMRQDGIAMSKIQAALGISHYKINKILSQKIETI